MTHISIKTNDDGRITNRYIGDAGPDWISISDDDWPDATPSEGEIPQYFYDSGTGDISIQYKTVTYPDNGSGTQ